MFGRKEGEAVPLLDFLKRPLVPEVKATLPAAIVEILDETPVLMGEYSSLLLRERLTLLGEFRLKLQPQIQEHEERLRWAAKVAAVLYLGHRPYLRSESDLVGFQKGRLPNWGSRLPTFQPPLPQSWRDRERYARQSGMFNTFLVVSPDPANFRSSRSEIAPGAGIVGLIFKNGKGVALLDNGWGSDPTHHGLNLDGQALPFLIAQKPLL